MEEGSNETTPSYVKLGDREMFKVEVRVGETTVVSWKKLMKHANKLRGSPKLPHPLPFNAHPNLHARNVPVQNVEGEARDAAAPNKFNAVIEKIERLYMGKDSSDDEDLKDVPDDDQYDTEDSFIDDTELDEYFEVDYSAIKHNGFFVNRGKLERISEPPVEPIQPQKKRRRKDSTKAPGESNDGRSSNKHSNVMKSAAEQITLGINSSNAPLNLAGASDQHDHLKFQNPPDTYGISSKKKSSETRTNLDLSLPTKVANGDASVPLLELKEIGKSKTGGPQGKTSTSKSKEASESSDALHMKYHDKSFYAQTKLQPSRPINNYDVIEASVQTKEKNGVHVLPDLNMPDGRIYMQATKPTHSTRKDGSNFRPRGSVLEKAIRELEKMVAESRPPVLDNQEADTSSQAIKRRLPREIKLKLAKVARLAASQGKISKELLNRLMSILGHIIQLRTLKRNLKVMITMGLLDKQQKDDKLQQMKKEVSEMVKANTPFVDCKALEQHDGTSIELKESSPDEKGFLKRKFSMDALLEEKICDLYDLFVDGLDEDFGPQARKLYVELANLWPSGSMDNHGIRRAICRAKNRRRRATMYSKYEYEEKLKKKKMLAPTEETVQIEGGVVAQPQYAQDRPSTDSSGPVLALISKGVPSSATAAAPVPKPSMNATNMDKVKQEKQKGCLNISMDEAKTGADGAPPTKKLKRKSELQYPENLHSQSSEERYNSLKQDLLNVPKKFNLQLNEQST